MVNENRRVQVKSMVNYKVGLFVPDLHFSRQWESESEVKSIDFNVLYEGLFINGVKTLFDEGVLYIENEQDRIDLGLQEPGDTKTMQLMNNGQILKLLKLDSAAKLKEVLKNSPREQITKIAEVAINERITDYEKCTLIKKACGIDVIACVQSESEE